ncbi:hypothetical protein CEXT_439211 [Caerostris extrusa]|uniref:Uncharacterized protein n=1 Tax=Caerostris extrusa TaxID=172846 RepID=A0AAV4N2Y1_CAEEX|nr:hypothetical protein CEXT_439211 [Caerostris extrusa]
MSTKPISFGDHKWRSVPDAINRLSKPFDSLYKTRKACGGGGCGGNFVKLSFPFRAPTKKSNTRAHKLEEHTEAEGMRLTNIHCSRLYEGDKSTVERGVGYKV